MSLQFSIEPYTFPSYTDKASLQVIYPYKKYYLITLIISNYMQYLFGVHFLHAQWKSNISTILNAYKIQLHYGFAHIVLKIVLVIHSHKVLNDLEIERQFRLLEG